MPNPSQCVKNTHIDEIPKNGQEDTVGKQLTGRARSLANLRPKPFVKGDPRINRSGRPKSFDHFRELAQRIAQRNEKAEEILSDWANSKDVQKQRAFVEYAFGKVPDKIETTGLENKTVLVLKFDHERPELAGRN